MRKLITLTFILSSITLYGQIDITNQDSKLKQTENGLVKMVFNDSIKSLAKKGYSILDEITKSGVPNLKKPLLTSKTAFTFKRTDLNVNLGYLSNPKENFSTEYQISNSYRFDFNLDLFNVPFNFTVNSRSNINYINQFETSLLPKMNFNSDKYLEKIREKVKSVVSPETIASSTIQRINAVKSSYINSLYGDLKDITDKYYDKYKDSLFLPVDIYDVGNVDVSSLYAKIFKESEISEYAASLEKIQKKRELYDFKELENDSLFKSYNRIVKRHEILETLYKKILYWRNSYQNNQVIKELSSQLPFEKGHFSSYLRSTENLKTAVKDRFSLTSMQQLFMNVTKFNIGNNPLTSVNSAFAPQNIMNSGLETEVKTAKLGVGIIYGKNTSTNRFLQGGLSSQVLNEFTNLLGLKISRGNNSRFQQSVSLNVFNFSNGNNGLSDNVLLQNNYALSPQHRDFVISVHHGFTIGSKHKIEFDISKSLGVYANNVDKENSVSKNAGISSLFSNKGLSNYAFTIDYSGIILKSDVNIHINNIGLGYSNPGNYLLRRGQSEIGIGFIRTFLNRKVNIKYNVDYRKQEFDPNGNYVFKTISNKSQITYRFNRSNRINISYKRSDYLSISPNQGTINGKNIFLQLDGNYKFKLRKYIVINTTTFAKQKYRLPVFTTDDGDNKSCILTHNSSILLKENILSFTFFGNKSESETYYFNTSSLSTEINYAYKIFKKINITSGLGYFNNYSWNKQLGISQQVGTKISNKLFIDFQLSYRKAIEIIRPEFANQININSTIKYEF